MHKREPASGSVYGPATRRRRIFTQYAAVFLVAECIFTGSAAAQQKRDLLSGNHTTDDLTRIVMSAADWHPFPRGSEREAWMAIPPGIRAGTICEAESCLGAAWPMAKASLFLEFVRTGNRERYQSVSFGRRERLATLVLAECMEWKGRFVDEIADGIWTICEESWWGAPAHLGLQKLGPGLPDVTEPTVDLFAAETGSLLAWTSYLLPEALDRVSPLLRERIRYEVRRRINDVNRTRDDFWWMGFSRTVNNWDPWICSNWLTTVLLLEDDPARRAASIHKILVCLDNFLNPYPPDGGCDEGPSYWTRAAGSLFDCLELLQSCTHGRIDVFADPLIGDMGRYICKAHIDGEYFLNFADAPARLQPDPSLVFRYGRAIRDTAMMRFGAYLAKEQRFGTGVLPGRFGVLGRVLPALFDADAVLGTAPQAPSIRDVWLPGIQVMGARSGPGSGGIYLGAQGGHNAESHNHNDVGNFVVYLDGRPILIDVGVETYTARTFGKDRYSIWTMQSAYHNVPTINGVMQKNGREFEAKKVTYRSDAATATLSMDIAAAYPADAHCVRWDRTVSLNRKDTVRIGDDFELEKVTGPTAFTFMAAVLPRVTGEGRIHLGGGVGAAAVIEFDPKLLSPNVEAIQINDAQLRGSWGDRLYRITLTSIAPERRGHYVTLIRRG